MKGEGSRRIEGRRNVIGTIQPSAGNTSMRSLWGEKRGSEEAATGYVTCENRLGTKRDVGNPTRNLAH